MSWVGEIGDGRYERGSRVNPHLDFLLSCIYDRNPLAREHVEDLRKSGLTDETIQAQKIRSVPPHMIDPILGFPTPKVTSAYLIPFADPRGGWMNHVRLKVFPSITTEQGTIKYLQPKRSGVRIYFPLATLGAVLHATEPLYIVEGEKKSLAVAQLGLPAIGVCGIEGWHRAGSRDLLPDFDSINLKNRVVELVPDGDVRTNPNVERGALRFAKALEACGARARIVVLPSALAHGTAA